MSNAELIQRLREFETGVIVDDPNELCRRAADALESCERARAESRHEIDKLKITIRKLRGGKP